MPPANNIMSDDYVFFCSHEPSKYPTGSPAVWVFSNWFIRPYQGANGVQYQCVEQEMMHQKALEFGDTVTAAKIMRASGPKQMKALGREVKGYEEGRWAQIRQGIVEKAIQAKFSQHEDLRQILLSTGERQLAEAASYDPIWGIGYSANVALLNRHSWGQNLLGKSLVNVRNRLG